MRQPLQPTLDPVHRLMLRSLVAIMRALERPPGIAASKAYVEGQLTRVADEAEKFLDARQT